MSGRHSREPEPRLQSRLIPLLAVLLGAGIRLTVVVLVRRPPPSDPTVTTAASTTAVTATTSTVASPSAATTAGVVTTAATATTASSPTTLADPLAALSLSPTGLGDLAFGSDAEEVIMQLALVLGDPDEDTGWSGAFETCPGTESRVVRWTSLQVFFTNGATEWAPEGTRHFFHFGQSIAAGGGELIELTTGAGIGIGSTLAELEAAYPGQVTVSDDPLFGPLWEVSVGGAGVLWGTAGSTADSAPIDSINGGPGCGE